MRQITLLTVTICMLLSFTAISQKRTGKNERFCQAEIIFMNKQSERYALSHFSNDSIFVYPLIADSIFNRMSLPAGDSATLSSRMLNRNALQSHQALSLSIETITSSPEADVLMLPVLPIFLLADIAFLIGSKGKKYPINAKEKKFYRMVNRLTGKYQNDTTELYPTF